MHISMQEMQRLIDRRDTVVAKFEAVEGAPDKRLDTENVVIALSTKMPQEETIPINIEL